MANTKSAKKRAIKSSALRDKNRAARSKMRTAIKKVRGAIAAGDIESARAALAAATRIVDAGAGKRLVHRNAAARTKSRLAAAVRKAAAK
jgi:small subunit ribosomal protein S20